jgi:hypothetical protein
LQAVNLGACGHVGARLRLGKRGQAHRVPAQRWCILLDALNKVNIYKKHLINDFYALIKVAGSAHKAGTPRVTVAVRAATLELR